MSCDQNPESKKFGSFVLEISINSISQSTHSTQCDSCCLNNNQILYYKPDNFSQPEFVHDCAGMCS